MVLTFLTDLSPAVITNTQHGELGLFLAPQPQREMGSQFPENPTQTSSLKPFWEALVSLTQGGSKGAI